MPTNVYFDTGTRPEQALYEDLMIEQLRIYGQDVYYMPRKLVNEDDIFGEDTLSSFNEAYLIEMYFENVDGYEGEKELMSKFGLDIQNEATFIVARRRWEQFVSIDSNLIVSSRPNEGDLIYFPKTQKLFEIGFVDHDDPFYQVHNVPAYKLKCRLFEYGHEDLATGIAEIDGVETDNSLNQLEYQVTLEQQGTINEQIRLEDRSGLIIQEDSGVNDYILAEDETYSGSIILENSVPGASPSYIILEQYNIQTIDEKSDNNDFERLDDTILDFTESNPFGDIGLK
jgi:hypothetical protein